MKPMLKMAILNGRLLLFLPLFVALLSEASAAEFSGIGNEHSNVSRVSADGTVVVGSNIYDVSSFEAFRWTQAEGMSGLGYLSGGSASTAEAVNANGTVVVGFGNSSRSQYEGFRWTLAGNQMTGLGFPSGASRTYAIAVNADGSVVAGYSNQDPGFTAFRWTQTGGFISLGTLGGEHTYPTDINADGTVVVGRSLLAAFSSDEAFRWTQAGGMTGLGFLPGGTTSGAYAVSADGSVVVGFAGGHRQYFFEAFRWTQARGMIGLGFLPGGLYSVAAAVNADGTVIVGSCGLSLEPGQAAFRWTEATGMQTVSQWLESQGGSLPSDWILREATGVSADGTVVVGNGSHNGLSEAWLVRGMSLVSLAELSLSLSAVSVVPQMMAAVPDLVMHGLHHHPLQMQRAAQKAAWVTGDFGRHNGRDTTLAVGEAGGSFSLWQGQLDVGLGVGTGATWQDLPFGGSSTVKGEHGYLELSHRAKGSPFVTTVSGMCGWYGSMVRRGYEVSGLPDSSIGRPGVSASSLQLRGDWLEAWKWGGVTFSPNVGYTIGRTAVDGYTETGGGFPATFNEQSHTSHGTRLGVVAEKALNEKTRLRGQMEWVHRFDQSVSRLSGTVTGLQTFDLAGASVKQNWMRSGLELERDLNKSSTAFVMFNATTPGEDPTYWINVGVQLRF